MTTQAIDALRETLPDAAKDLRIALSAVLGSEVLSADQKWGVAVSCAIVSRNPALRDAVLSDAIAASTDAVIDDARAAAAMMGMNNIFYRFRHFIGKASYGQKPARLRMQRLGQPKTSKADFELMCLAVSAIHGCESCVKSHEKVVLEGGLTEDHVHDAIRIAAVLHGVAIGLELGA